MGVFATRSPFRPNHLGLTCVSIESIEKTEEGRMCIIVSGADMTDGTEIYDIKPYIPYADAYPDARGGFAQAEENRDHRLNVVIPDSIVKCLTDDELAGLTEILSLDPRPSYQDDPERIYGISYAGYNIKFKVAKNELTVISAEK